MSLRVEDHHTHLGPGSRNQAIQHPECRGLVIGRSGDGRFSQVFGAMQRRVEVAPVEPLGGGGDPVLPFLLPAVLDRLQLSLGDGEAPARASRSRARARRRQPATGQSSETAASTQAQAIHTGTGDGARSHSAAAPPATNTTTTHDRPR